MHGCLLYGLLQALFLREEGEELGVEVVLHTPTGLTRYTPMVDVALSWPVPGPAGVRAGGASHALSKQLHGLEQLFRDEQTRLTVASLSLFLSLSLALALALWFSKRPLSLTLTLTLSLTRTRSLTQHLRRDGIQRRHVRGQQRGRLVQLLGHRARCAGRTPRHPLHRP